MTAYVVYEKSIGTKMNDLGLCLEVISRSLSIIALHSTLNISETVRDRDLIGFQRTTNRKWPMEYQMVT